MVKAKTGGNSGLQLWKEQVHPVERTKPGATSGVSRNPQTEGSFAVCYQVIEHVLLGAASGKMEGYWNAIQIPDMRSVN